MERRIKTKMKQKINMYNEEDIKKEFTIITDEEYRDAVINHEFPDYMYGYVLPEYRVLNIVNISNYEFKRFNRRNNRVW